MPPKGKNAKKEKTDADLDDFAFLEEEAAKNRALLAAAAPPPVPSDVVTPPAATATVKAGGAAGAAAAAAKTAAEDDGDSDGDDGGAGGEAKKDKKKKKKKPAAEKKEVEKPLSAAGKAILERQRLLAEEEARIKKIQDEEDAKIAAEEAAEAAAAKAIEDEKEKRRLLKQAKVDAQKAAGTYMTKAEKEKAKKTQARIESLKAAGMLASIDPNEAKVGDKVSSMADMYANNKKKAATKAEAAKSAAKEKEEEEERQRQKAEAEAKAAADLEPADDWETDDWDVKVDLLSSKVSTLVAAQAADVEDQLELDEKATQEKLRALGKERERRDEIERIRREEEEKERAEMDRIQREAAMRKENSRKRRNERDAVARAARSPLNLRSPISCIMGHVDTGKTKLLDKIRHTNVQEGEAGGITQQIGATQFSRDTLLSQTLSLRDKFPFDIRLPGLLVIDTPGHESFSNLRSRGSSLCDVAILVIDLMHGLEQQTIESLNMLRKKKTPFVVALNKVDRCYGWKTMPDSPIRDALEAQDDNCKSEFKDRAAQAILALNEQGLNAKLYWDNDDPTHTVSLVPTSAISGEGVPDLIMMVIRLTQELQQEKLMYMNVLQCTVLEVKVVEGLGHTVDVVLVNGTLKEGDTIVVSTMEGPVVTQIRALLTPPPNREMRVKSEYVHHQVLTGAIGIKIVAPDISRAIAGTPVLVIEPEDDVEDVKEDVQSDLSQVMKALETDSKGVMVHASTLGALEALLQFLREECKPPIPVSHINIGPIYKKDVMRANIMNEKGQPEFATILAFDVKVDSEAQLMADENHVRIFTAEIIYHLFDQFSAYMRGITESRRAAAEAVVQFPCVVKILPQHVFNKKDPIVMGVDVTEGTLRLGTLLCVPSLSLDVGKVISIQNNHREVPSAKKGASVAIKLSNEGNPNIMYGRQFDHTHALYSKISRASIDALKDYFKDDMGKEDWQLVIKLKTVFNIT